MVDRSGFPACLMAMGLIGTGVEVGVFKGEYANLLLRGWPGILVGVDCYNNGEETYLLDEALAKNDEFVREGRYRIIVLTSLEAEKITSGELDFVFLDADHSYSACRADIAAWWPKIKPGGILCGHDYDELRDAATGFVKQAVNEFCASNPELVLHVKVCSSWFIQKV